MLDKLSLNIPKSYPVINDFGKNESISAYGITCEPERNKYNYEITRYVGYIQNMRVEIYSNRIEISGSLSRFYYGCNSRDLSISDLKNAIEYLCNIFGCKPQECSVKFLEFGFNIPIDLQISELLTLLIKHKNARIEDKYYATRFVQKRFVHYDYAFKIYNKSFEQLHKQGIKLDRDYIRIELQCKRKYFKKSILTAYDLISEQSLISLFKKFAMTWESILKGPFVDTSKLTSAERDWYFARLCPLFWKDLKDKNRNSAKVELYRFRKFLKENGDDSLFSKIKNDFTIKFHNLLEEKNTDQFQPTIVVGKRVQKKPPKVNTAVADKLTHCTTLPINSAKKE